MDIDTEKGTISYKVGDVDYGVAFTKPEFKTTTLYPFVGLTGVGDKVEITTLKQPDSGEIKDASKK